MAYWLYCQACKQWSKSPTALSEDKSCPFCDHLLTKAKKHFSSRSNDAGIVDEKEPQRKQPIPLENDLSLKTDESDLGTSEGSVRQESPSVLQTPVISETSASTPDEAPTELDTSAAIEGVEQPAVTETSAKPEVSDLIEVTKEITATVINDVPDAANTPVTDEIPDEAKALESIQANETASSAAQGELKTTETVAESKAFEEAEVSEDEIQEESASSVVQNETNEMEETEDPEVSNTSETPDGQEALESEESSEEEEAFVIDEEPDQSESSNTPAHRMYMEDKRRKRKQR